MTSTEPGPQGRWAGNTLAEFERNLADNLCYERGTTAESASALDAYWTLAVTVRDRLADRRARTARANYEANPKFVYYLSAEYMLGRQLRQNALYTGTGGLARQAMAGSGFSAGELEELDVEPGLGNGGLGRLAACLLDSLATLDVPAVGYGIRYEFGIFKQAFEDGHQVEHPDDWTFYGNPWEFPAPDDLQVIGFYGHTEPADDDQGGLRARWLPAEVVRGEPSQSRPGRSPAGPSPTPATPCCPRRWRRGRCRCSGGCCPATFRSSMPSITSSWKTCAPGIRVTTGASPGCR